MDCFKQIIHLEEASLARLLRRTGIQKCGECREGKRWLKDLPKSVVGVSPKAFL